MDFYRPMLYKCYPAKILHLTVPDRPPLSIPVSRWSTQRNKENNRMGKARDLFKKIRDTKGIFHAKMGSMKDRNGMHLTEEDIKKRWQEYTEELY